MRNHLYYSIKPIISRRVRFGIRRWFASRKRDLVRNTWPILPGSERPPEGWPGWPDGKKFALVLTHDVEGMEGLAKCRQLMELEMSLGFRSSFNFVPEGEYSVAREFREELERNGFEVGIHDLHHDGKLFWSKAGYLKSARKINQYLQDWNAVGFRSAFMLHQLDWTHALELQYDASTFDTDPFEPQPDGVATIYPFWVPYPGRGYAELPYTLNQDSTLFFVLGETTTAIWEAKLQWIADQGGMALLNTHPDYMGFNEFQSPWEYPASHYVEFLKTIKKKYGKQLWNPLPKTMASFVKDHQEILRLQPTPENAEACRAMSEGRKKIWIDLENTPHIPFFKPIARELEARGFAVVFTARDAFQTCEMATAYGFRYEKIGRHYGKSRILKVWGLLIRSMQLLPFVLREKPVVAVNHGSRAQTLICNLLRIPTIMAMDYEHTQVLPLVKPRWEIIPEVVPQHSHEVTTNSRVLKYTGIKEDVYVPEFKPDSSIIQQLGINGEVIVTVRPPATEAHYHNPETEILFESLMDHICSIDGVRAVMLPRNEAQKRELEAKHPSWFKNSKTIVPEGVVNGLNLLWHSDLAVSGGGTMNREAAALGIPVYSIFRGTIGAVDRQLEKDGRLIMIQTADDIRKAIQFRHRDKSIPPENQPRKALKYITTYIENITRMESHGQGSK